MPLIARCEKCGQEVEVKEIRDRGGEAFIILYECPKCKLTIVEEICKREY